MIPRCMSSASPTVAAAEANVLPVDAGIGLGRGIRPGDGDGPAEDEGEEQHEDDRLHDGEEEQFGHADGLDEIAPGDDQAVVDAPAEDGS